MGDWVTFTAIVEHRVINRDYPVIGYAARSISTPILRNMGTIGGNLLLDTRCNYYDQNYEWRKGINFCLKKDGDVCWVDRKSTRLNSSHQIISYAVFCLKKKKNTALLASSWVESNLVTM